jgi:hypothetical protein
MRQENERQVIADRTRVAGVCMIDAGAVSINDEALRMHDQSTKANGRKQKYRRRG